MANLNKRKTTLYDTLRREEFALFERDGASMRDAAFETPPVGYFKDAMRRFVKSKSSVVAFIIIGLIILLAAVGPYISPHGYNDQFHDFQNMPPKIPFLAKLGIADGSRVLKARKVATLGDTSKYPEGSILSVGEITTVKGMEVADVVVDYYVYKGCDETFWFGSDYMGRDIFTRLWRGTRVSLFIAFVAAIVNTVVGVVYGAISGYYGGKIDMVMMRVAEILRAFPRIVIMTLFIMYFGTGIFSIVMSQVMRGWVDMAQMVRAQFYRFKGREFVLASRTLGVGDGSIMFRHILPNSIGPVITSMMFAIPSAIFAESFLAYIGLGLQAPEPSIGVMLSAGQDVLLSYPSQTLFPALVISILMISFNLFANGLRDALDPTGRGAE